LSDPIPLFRCASCGEAGKRVDLSWNDKVVGTFTACQSCIDRTTATLDRVRPIFDAMIAAGVDRDLANEALRAILEDPRFKE
jgi:hypothetical protein